MGVTYRSAVDRDTARAVGALQRFGAADAGLAIVSALAALIVVAAATARIQTSGRIESAGGSAAVNVNTADARSVEPALGAIYPTSADRQLAAQELLGSLVRAEGERRHLPNVGALARARIAAAAIDGAPAAAAFQERLRAERARAAQAGERAPEAIPLFASGQLAAVKPFFVVRDRGEYFRSLLLWLGLYVAAFQIASLFWRTRGVRGDRVLLVAAHALTALGLAAMVSRPDPLRDLLLFERYTQGVVLGVGVAALIAAVRLRTSPLPHMTYLPLIAAALLSVALIVFGRGPTGSNAKVNLGPVQPIEAIRLLLALFLAGYFAQRWELLRAVRSRTLRGIAVPRWLNLPRGIYVLPVVCGVAAALALFFLQKDLGPALMLAVVFLATYAIARGTVGLALAGAALLAAGFYAGYSLGISATLADRVRMWQAPWDNLARGGDQIAQALWALASGGTLGTGFGLGDTRHLPAGHTDLILASIAEELGAAGLLIAGALYAAVVWRALSTARRASTDYGFFLAVVLTLSLAVPVFLMAAGLLGLAPLTGVVTPFLSFGGSAMLANFVALGLLSAIRADGVADPDTAMFRRPLRVLSSAMAAAAVVIAAAAVYVQVVAADEILVRPHLGVQADGTRRFQYNPRVLDVARQIPRGTIVDRRGLPLATVDDALLKKAAAEYQKLGVTLQSECGDGGARCYPLGGRGFHVLGDARSRVNWSAGNTAFVERDSEARLRGYDDHQTTIRVADASGGDVAAVMRDYRDLIPLVRHRHEPGHRDVKAFMSRPREVRLTLDARLQARTADILARYAQQSASGRAAAVAIDPDTGAILASASYPWPESAAVESGADREALLDRARFGLYPPGSTFKLLTAAAALREDPRAASRAFTCSRLPDGRVGVKLPGWARPIRDDVLDHQPHGRLEMGRAVAVSCNAYFAQLALALGPRSLIDLAQIADVSLARANDVSRVRATLPQAGYGQGDVLATPMRLARVAAAVAANGVIRDARIDRDAKPDPGTRLMTAEAARALAGFMRGAVRDGTGRSLSGHPLAIAGKTGTAEVGDNRSHAWFVGFAPYGRAERRIAVAVIIENAGYGGRAAAPAAGEILAAAAAEGLIR